MKNCLQYERDELGKMENRAVRIASLNVLYNETQKKAKLHHSINI